MAAQVGRNAPGRERRTPFSRQLPCQMRSRQRAAAAGVGFVREVSPKPASRGPGPCLVSPSEGPGVPDLIPVRYAQAAAKRDT